MLRLKVYEDQEKVQELEVQTEVLSIGREPDNTLVLSDASVSRRHAQLEPHGNFFLVRDNGSTNGTFVNEMLARVQVLSHGDTIRIGKYILRVEQGPKRAKETTRVRVESLRFPGQGRKAPREREAGVRFEGEASVYDASREKLLRLYRIQKQLGYVNTTEALLESALETILAEVGADRASVLLCGEGAESVELSQELFRPVAVKSTDEVLTSRGRDGEIIIPSELLVEAAVRSHGARSPAGAGSGEEVQRMASPLRERNRLRGIVYVERLSSASPFTEDDLQFLNAISGELAIAQSNAELFDQVSLERSKVQAILSSLTDGILVTDQSYRIVDANASALVLLDVEDKFSPGADLFGLLKGFCLVPSADILRSSGLREGAVFHLKEARGESEGGHSMIAGRMLPYPRGKGTPQGVLVVLRDRSDARRLEELKTGFLGDVAHKLRTPLTVIQGNLPFLREEVEDGSPSLELLDEVERNSRSLCSLIDQLIEYTELEVRSLKSLTSPGPIDLRNLIQETVSAAEGEGGSRGVHISLKLPEDLPVVAGRSEHLRQALAQILGNAVKFCGEGGLVNVSAEALEGYVRIDFVDNGPGIPAPELEAVFYACHQVDLEKTGQVPGAGLGLTIARHVVQAHGGEVEITSPYGFADHGTRVSVTLPTQDRPVPSRELPDKAEPVEEGMEPSVTTRKQEGPK